MKSYKSMIVVSVMVVIFLLIGCDSGGASPTPMQAPTQPPLATATNKPQLPTPTYGVAGPTPTGGQKAAKIFDLKGCCLHGISWSPDGKMLAIGFNHNIQLWNINDSAGFVLSGHTADVTDVSWSPDGKFIASVSLDTTGRIWTVDGKQVSELKGHTDRLTDVVWSANSTFLATAGVDGNVFVWQANGQLLSSLMLMSNADMSNNPPVQSISWAPNNFTLAISAGKTIDLEHTNMRVPGSINTGVESNEVSWSGDGKYIASAGADKMVSIWNLNGELGNPTTGSVAGVITPTLKVNMAGHTAEVLSVAWSPDSQLLASGSVDHTIRIWTNDGKLISILTDHNAEVTSLAWSPDGAFLASASNDGTVHLWKMKK